MSLLRTGLVLPGLARGLSSSPALLAGRKKRDQLKVPVDKEGIVIGKRKWARYWPKDGVSDKSHPVHVKWDRPVTMQTCNAEISGDVGGLETLGLERIDLSKPPLALEGAPALATASPEVARVTSLEFARRRDIIDKLSLEVVKSIQRHPRDFKSIEVVIALKTVRIRNMQRALIQQWPYKNQDMKHSLTHMISSRRNCLRQLREMDYKKYEWLLEKLNLLYKPMPWDEAPGVHGEKEGVTRKKSLERLTDLWCEELRRHRLAALRRDLEARQPEFLLRKAETLEGILATEEELGIQPTVSREEVEECRSRAAAIEARLQAGEAEEVEEEEYMIYKPEVQREQNVFVR